MQLFPFCLGRQFAQRGTQTIGVLPAKRLESHRQSVVRPAHPGERRPLQQRSDRLHIPGMGHFRLFFTQRPGYASQVVDSAAPATEVAEEDIQSAKPAQPRDAFRKRRRGMGALHEFRVCLQPPQVGAQPVYGFGVKRGLLERAGKTNRMSVIESRAFLDRLHGVRFERRQRRAWNASVTPYATSPAPGSVNSQA